jgi:putative ABC transport system permease protein
LPRLDEIHVDLPVLGATVAATLVSAVAFGLAPALHAASAGVPHASNRVAGHRRQRRLRSSLVVLEVAAALVLLVGGGLLLRSLARVLSVDPGFSNESVVSMNVFLTGQKYRQLDQQKAYVARAIADLGTVPGVAAAGAISHLPLGGGASTQPFVIEARDVAAGDAPSADYRVISPGYFATMGIAIREGRAFTDGDRETSERVVIVNETMARRFWGGASPIGSRLRWATPSRAREGVMTVVGVAGDVRSVGLDADERPAIYAPFTQRTLPFLRWTSFVVRTAGDPVAAIPVIRRALLTIDPEQPVYEETTIAQLLAASVAERRFSLLLLGIFAIVALALATIGLYGLISFSVAERTREIGVRVALGASARRVYLLVLTEALTRTAAGLLIGLAGAVALSRWLGALLYQVAPTDPLTYAAVTALLLASAIVAGYVPARRAVRADPVEALRAD